MEGAYLRTGKELYHRMARFWTKVFALAFAIGVATGIVMEFEFGTNWATYSAMSEMSSAAHSRRRGSSSVLSRVRLSRGAALWLEPREQGDAFLCHPCMVCLGAHFSAVWIVVANSWQQTPAGYQITHQGVVMPPGWAPTAEEMLHTRAEITDFWAMVFNPSSMDRLSHDHRLLAGRRVAGDQRERVLSAAPAAIEEFARATMEDRASFYTGGLALAARLPVIPAPRAWRRTNPRSSPHSKASTKRRSRARRCISSVGWMRNRESLRRSNPGNAELHGARRHG